MKRTWKQLVADGKRIRRLESQAQWEWGDLAIEVVEEGRTLEEFADEVDVDLERLRSYHRVAAAWPASRRLASTSWTTHRELVNHQEHIRRGMTLREARAAIGRTPIDYPKERDTPLSRIAAAEDLLADPEVRQAVVSDPKIRRSLVQAQHDANIERRLRQTHDVEQAEETYRPIMEVLAELGLVGFEQELSRLAGALHAAVETGKEFPLDWTRRVHGRLDDMVEDLVVASERSSDDEQIRALLDGER